MKNKTESGFGALGIVETAKKAIGTALLHHRAIGNEIVFWQNGKIVREKLTTAPHVQEKTKHQQINNLD